METENNMAFDWSFRDWWIMWMVVRDKLIERENGNRE